MFTNFPKCAPRGWYLPPYPAALSKYITAFSDFGKFGPIGNTLYEFRKKKTEIKSQILSCSGNIDQYTHWSTRDRPLMVQTTWTSKLLMYLTVSQGKRGMPHEQTETHWHEELQGFCIWPKSQLIACKWSHSLMVSKSWSHHWDCVLPLTRLWKGRFVLRPMSNLR